jgi:hypothetical protein
MIIAAEKISKPRILSPKAIVGKKITGINQSLEEG